MTVFFIRYRSQKPLRLIRVVSRKDFFAGILQDLYFQNSCDRKMDAIQ